MRGRDRRRRSCEQEKETHQTEVTWKISDHLSPPPPVAEIELLVQSPYRLPPPLPLLLPYQHPIKYTTHRLSTEALQSVVSEFTYMCYLLITCVWYTL